MKGVIQIGAHLAEEYDNWYAMGVRNFILFEPIMNNYLNLLNRFSANPRVKLYKKALGNKVDQIKMFVDQNKMSSSILEPLEHLNQYPDIKFDNYELVDLDKLDNIDYNRSHYDHLHIDGQGYELEILKGAVESLKFISTITTEVYKTELYKGCPMIEEVSDWLSKQGFELKSVSWRGGTWGDAEYSR